MSLPKSVCKSSLFLFVYVRICVSSCYAGVCVCLHAMYVCVFAYAPTVYMCVLMLCICMRVRMLTYAYADVCRHARGNERGGAVEGSRRRRCHERVTKRYAYVSIRIRQHTHTVEGSRRRRCHERVAKRYAVYLGMCLSSGTTILSVC